MTHRVPNLVKKFWLLALTSSAVVIGQQTTADPGEYYWDYKPEAQVREIKRNAVSDIAVMVPMRDGIGLDTDVYRPKDAKGLVPTILWKTPYNEIIGFE